MEAATESTTYTRELAIDAPPEAVWEFLVDPDKAVRWMGQKATFEPRPGGLYRVEIVPEIYPDLTYAPDGKLVVERQKKAADPDFATAQVTQFLRDGTVSATDGSPISLAGSRSACVHGDAANAVVVAQAVGAAADAAGYEVGAVTP